MDALITYARRRARRFRYALAAILEAFVTGPMLLRIAGIAPVAGGAGSTAVAPMIAETPLPAANINPSSGALPFRVATYERTQNIIGEALTYASAGVVQLTVQTLLQRDIVGDGYMYGIVVSSVMTVASNSAAVTQAEDAPWNQFVRAQLSDISGDVLNLSGWGWYLANLLGAQYAVFYPDTNAHSVLFTFVTGAGGTGGSYSFDLRYQVGTGRRDLYGIAPNQSRTQKYTLSETYAPFATMYGTAPANAALSASLAVSRVYENYAVPNDTGPNGQQQESLPPSWGIIHRTTETNTAAVPAPSSTVTHAFPQVGNTVRGHIITLRSNSLRATAETNNPTLMIMKAGSATIFQESWRYRKYLDMQRYGFDMPNGVVFYDYMHDFERGAGQETGDDWMHTQQLTDLHIEVTYPAGWTAAGSSMIITTDELLNVRPAA